MTTLRIITRDERRDEDCFVKLKHTGFLSPGVETGGGTRLFCQGTNIIFLIFQIVYYT